MANRTRVVMQLRRCTCGRRGGEVAEGMRTACATATKLLCLNDQAKAINHMRAGACTQPRTYTQTFGMLFYSAIFAISVCNTRCAKNDSVH